jgi:ABC-type dipeptide/oligopeptide/nickel transport system ATPase component
MTKNKKVDYSKDNSVINFYDLPEVKKLDEDKKFVNKYFANTNINLPCRIGLIGATGSGKSNILLNFITRTPDTFTKIIIVHKIDEKLYDFLKKKLDDQIMFYKGLEELPGFNDLGLTEKDKVLMIFDDIVNEPEKKQEKIIGEYFLLGRKVKAGISLFYLSQMYFKIPKFIREQLSHLFLIKIQDSRDIPKIIKYNSVGIQDKDVLLHMYETATQKQFGFLKIDFKENDINKKFSINWLEFFTFD